MSGWRWPLGIAAGLLGVIAINGVMVATALRHPSAAVSLDPYGDALAFDQVVERRRRAHDLGWEVAVRGCTDFAPCAIAVAIRDGDGRPVAGLSGLVQARRGDDARFDRELALREGAPGVYFGETMLGSGGIYRLDFDLRSGDLRWVGTRHTVLGEVAP